MLNNHRDMTSLQQALRSVECPQQMKRVRGAMERLQQLRKFPDSRRVEDLRQPNQ
jgi:hypothetical protein